MGFIIAGIIVGLIAGMIMKGKSYGLAINLITGVIGGFLGGKSLYWIGIGLNFKGFLGEIYFENVNYGEVIFGLLAAAIGASILLIIIYLFKKK